MVATVVLDLATVAAAMAAAINMAMAVVASGHKCERCGIEGHTIAHCWTESPTRKPDGVLTPHPASKRQEQIAARVLTQDRGGHKRRGGVLGSQADEYLSPNSCYEGGHGGQFQGMVLTNTWRTELGSSNLTNPKTYDSNLDQRTRCIDL